MSKLLLLVLITSVPAFSQTIDKVSFDISDSSNGYYLAIPPRSNQIKGTLVLFNSFSTPERMLPETKLHNVAYANDLLTIMVSMKQKLYADTSTIERLNTILKHVLSRYSADTSKFVLVGYDFAGNIALRYTELTNEHSASFVIRPRAVIAIDSPVDLFGLWNWSERQVRNNSQSVGDATYILDLMTKETGAINNKRELYEKLTPFNNANSSIGNEQYLKNTPVRLYYDADVEWFLKNGKSLYDTNIPDGSELVRRLKRSGNQQAELISAKQPGMNSGGIRTTNSLSIVDEVECIHWIKNILDIFDPHTWKPPYDFPTLPGWQEERFAIPIDFAPDIRYKGVEDVRFAPGWGDEKSEQYWSYTYLWWLEGREKIDAPILKKHLTSYYDGLVKRNVIERKIPAGKVVPTHVVMQNIRSVDGDVATYSGTIKMLDYMTQRPVNFNCLAHVKKCLGNRTVVIIAISPKSLQHPVWIEMNKMSDRFECPR